MPGHLSPCSSQTWFEIHSFGALGMCLDWPQPIIVTSPLASVTGSENCHSKPISICLSPGHGDWFRGGPINSKLSDLFFNLWIWAKQRKRWSLQKPSCALREATWKAKPETEKGGTEWISEKQAGTLFWQSLRHTCHPATLQYTNSLSEPS